MTLVWLFAALALGFVVPFLGLVAPFGVLAAGLVLGAIRPGLSWEP